MGPFQHKIDNGLENRKAAYECLVLLMGGLKWDSEWILERALDGLQDPNSDIKSISMQILPLFSSFTLNSQNRYELLLERLEEIVFSTVKETAVKQEIENNKQLVKAGQECVRALDKIKHVKWKEFMKRVEMLKL
jgi:hypothetical protein